MTTVTLVRGDITTADVDVIVNAANGGLVPGGGVDGAIRRAGGPSITKETSRLGPVATGAAVSTTAGRLTASHLVHAVGPVWGQADPEESDRLLASCYRSSLDLAAGLGARSIAFPNISTGIFGFPALRAAVIATDAVRKWIEEHPGTIDLVAFFSFDDTGYRIYSELLGL